MNTSSMESTAIVILGAGKLGRVLVRQLVQSVEFHRQRHGVSYRIAAWADSTAPFVAPGGLAPEVLSSISSRKEAGDSFAAQGGVTFSGRRPEGSALALVRDLDADPALRSFPPILVDVTSTAATAPALEEALRLGWSVATANKLPLAGPQELFERLTTSPRFRYESTVASAVPVIEACVGLLRSGDRVDGFTGALSGTLGFLMTGLEDGKPFSKLVALARERGYTENDPRADLGGGDVARKALILARTLGRRLEFSDVSLDPLVAPDLGGRRVEDFVRALPELDAGFAQRVAEARAAGRTLRYVAAMDESGVAVGPVAVPKGSALGLLRGNDNLLAISSRYYPDLPLVLQGRGDGVEAAAGGVHGDIVNHLVAARRDD